MPVVFSLRAQRSAFASVLLSAWVCSFLERYADDGGDPRAMIGTRVVKILRVFPFRSFPGPDVTPCLHVPVMIADATHFIYAVLPQATVDAYEMANQHRVTLDLVHKLVLISLVGVQPCSVAALALWFGYTRLPSVELPVLVIGGMEKFDANATEGSLTPVRDVYNERQW